MNKKSPEDMTLCECCGQMRPHPTRPGRWEYKQYGLGAWRQVTIKYDDEGLTMTHDGETLPDWWPNNAQWRKVDGS